jgi:bacterioferritin (cytochrome b1)
MLFDMLDRPWQCKVKCRPLTHFALGPRSAFEIKKGENPKEMFEVDLASKSESFEACKEIIRMPIREDNVVTDTVMENILAETEEHAYKFRKRLG